MRKQHINSGRVVQLKTLIMSMEITDKTTILIKDVYGHPVTAGEWFRDNILNLSERWGMATSEDEGKTITFRLSYC